MVRYYISLSTLSGESEVKSKPKLESIIWNCATTSTRERLVSHALIRLQNKDSSRAPFQGLDISLAEKDWDDLREDTQKQIKNLLRNTTAAIKKEGSDIHSVLKNENPEPLHNAIQNAVANAIVSFALRDK